MTEAGSGRLAPDQVRKQHARQAGTGFNRHRTKVLTAESIVFPQPGPLPHVPGGNWQLAVASSSLLDVMPVIAVVTRATRLRHTYEDH
jgi:hypothetical protein